MADENLDEILKQLKLTNAILRAGFQEQLDAMSDTVMADPVFKSIVDALMSSAQEVPSGQLQSQVAQACGVTARTVRERLAVLIRLGVIYRSGQGPTTAYGMTALFGD